jgi:hypothetical protein
LIKAHNPIDNDNETDISISSEREEASSGNMNSYGAIRCHAAFDVSILFYCKIHIENKHICIICLIVIFFVKVPNCIEPLVRKHYEQLLSEVNSLVVDGQSTSITAEECLGSVFSKCLASLSSDVFYFRSSSNAITSTEEQHTCSKRTVLFIFMYIFFIVVMFLFGFIDVLLIFHRSSMYLS